MIRLPPRSTRTDTLFPTRRSSDLAKPRAEHMQPGVYSPYGRGPHTCLGKSLAEIQIALSMARLFYKLDLELESPNYVLKTKTAPTPGPAMDFKLRVEGLRHCPPSFLHRNYLAGLRQQPSTSPLLASPAAR